MAQSSFDGARWSANGTRKCQRAERPARAGLNTNPPRHMAARPRGSGWPMNPTHIPRSCSAPIDGEPFTLDDATRRRHLHVVGQTGAGKSTLFANLIAQDLAAGRGVGRHRSARLAGPGRARPRAEPSARTSSSISIPPTWSGRSASMSSIGVHPDQHAVVADDVVSAFLHIWGGTAGGRARDLLTQSIRALLVHPRLDPARRAPPVHRRHLPRAHPAAACAIRSCSPSGATNWAATTPRFRTQVDRADPEQARQVLPDNRLRNIVAQPKSTIDLRRIMDEGRILIVNLARARSARARASARRAFLDGACHRPRSRAPTRRDGAPAVLPLRRRVPELRQRRLCRDPVGGAQLCARPHLGHQYLGQLSEHCGRPSRQRRLVHRLPRRRRGRAPACGASRAQAGDRNQRHGQPRDPGEMLLTSFPTTTPGRGSLSTTP